MNIHSMIFWHRSRTERSRVGLPKAPSSGLAGDGCSSMRVPRLAMTKPESADYSMFGESQRSPSASDHPLRAQ